MNLQTETVKHFITNHNLLCPNSQVLVALSGGADSVCLLLMLRELGYQVEAAHCNFHLRSEESQRDEDFVRALCQRLNVTLHVQDFDTEAFARKHHISIEMAARQQRYDWFNQLLQEHNLDVICTGHHRDDNVETLLLNLVRGTGLKGLCGMQPRQGKVVRPLLCLSKADILDYLDQKGEAYVTDSSNLHDDYARNKIRLDILPLLRQINPAADENILTCIENLNEAEKMYRYCVDEFCSAALDGPSELDIATILRAPSPLSVLHELLSPFGFNRSQIKDIFSSIHTTGKYFSSPTHRLAVNRDQLLIENNGQRSMVNVQCSMVNGQRSMVNGQWSMVNVQCSIEPYTPDFTFEKSADIAYYDADILEGKHLSVRPVHTGDRFSPFGMKGTKLVSDLLTDLKLSIFEKEQQQVLCADDEIIWVIGRRSSEKYKVTAATQKVLRVCSASLPTAP